MSGKFLQIIFKFEVSVADHVDTVTPLADEIARVPALLQKVWLTDEAESEAGGLCRFGQGNSLQACLDGPIVAGVASHPALEDIDIKIFDNIERLSEITRGPVFGSAA